MNKKSCVLYNVIIIQKMFKIPDVMSFLCEAAQVLSSFGHD